MQNPDHFKVMIGRSKEDHIGFVLMNPDRWLKFQPFACDARFLGQKVKERDESSGTGCCLSL